MRKVVGLLLLLSLPIVLMVFGVSRFVLTSLASNTSHQTQPTPTMNDTTENRPRTQEGPFGLEAYGTLTPLRPPSPLETAASVLNLALSLFGLFGIFVGIPLGIYLLATPGKEKQQMTQSPSSTMIGHQ